MTPTIQHHRDEISELCRRFQVRRLDIFGSAARGRDFESERSDADFLVEFEADGLGNLATFIDLQEALQNLLRRPIDLVERRAIETSRNYIRRRRILGEAELVYLG